MEAMAAAQNGTMKKFNWKDDVVEYENAYEGSVPKNAHLTTGGWSKNEGWEMDENARSSSFGSQMELPPEISEEPEDITPKSRRNPSQKTKITGGGRRDIHKKNKQNTACLFDESSSMPNFCNFYSKLDGSALLRIFKGPMVREHPRAPLNL